MGEILKQSLRGLCNRTGWCYAVFWKLKRRSRMVLTWEDGYYEFAPVQTGLNVSLLTGNGRIQQSANLLEHGIYGQDEDQIELAVAKMSFHVYSLGEGIIGRVAFTGKHQWINGDRAAAFENSFAQRQQHTAQEKLPDGWENQFGAGIKTIAVVAVPQGVVQLGSLQMIAEDLNLVCHIRTLFGTLQSVISEYAPDAQSGRAHHGMPGRISAVLAAPKSIGSGLINVSGALATDLGRTLAGGGISLLTMERKPSVDMQALSFGSEGMMTGLLTNYAAPQQQSEVELFKRPKMHSNASASLMDNLVHEKKARASHISTSASPTFEQSKLAGESGNFGMNLGVDEFSCEGYDYNSLFKSYPKDDLDELNGLIDSISKEIGIHVTSAGVGGKCTDTVTGVTGSTGTGSQFTIGDELSEAFTLNNNNNNFISKNGYTKDSLFDMLMSDEPSMKNVDVSSSAASGLCDILGLTESKGVPLLDAVVAGATTPVAALSAPPSLKHTHGMPTEGDAGTTAAAAAASIGGDCEEVNNKWVSSVKVVGTGAAWIERSSASSSKKMEDATSRSNSNGNKKQEEQVAKVVGRKRLRPGEASRPRPKDRQQIQDRLRELREIVPNATKQCSIDALLEKTVKHMHFLQSVTQHGDKLRDAKMMETSNVGDGKNLDNGASWAMEFGGQGMGCPIVVKNLKQPKQMLVEMMCEEKGLFLEIADNIKGLGLTIVKGVMECRGDKIWARFIVEASVMEVKRMSVLLSLMQLMELNLTSNHNNSVVTASDGVGDVYSAYHHHSHHIQHQQQHGMSITVSPSYAV